MTTCDVLQSMMDDGAWDGATPVDIGNGFAVSPGKDGIAVFGDHFGGMVAVPWAVVRKLVDYLPNATAHGRAVASTLQQIVGNSELEAKHGHQD